MISGSCQTWNPIPTNRSIARSERVQYCNS